MMALEPTLLSNLPLVLAGLSIALIIWKYHDTSVDAVLKSLKMENDEGKAKV